MSETKTTDRDLRLAVQLTDSLGLKTSDTQFKLIWRIFFARGDADSRTPPNEWDL